VAEGGGLLNRYTVQSRIMGSNPILSAPGCPQASASIQKQLVKPRLWAIHCPGLFTGIHR
jgi:hypothetical protein